MGRTAGDSEPSNELALPGSWFEAIFRGTRNVCPRCGGNPLFGRFLKPVSACFNCGQDWSLQSADDFPAYLSILITGHLVVPLIMTLTSEFDLSLAVLVAIILPLTLLLILALLQPAKGAVIATQWWLGMNGFKAERSDDQEHLPAEVAIGEAASPRRTNSFGSRGDGSSTPLLHDARSVDSKARAQVAEPLTTPQPCNAKYRRDNHDNLH